MRTIVSYEADVFVFGTRWIVGEKLFYTFSLEQSVRVNCHVCFCDRDSGDSRVCLDKLGGRAASHGIGKPVLVDVDEFRDKLCQDGDFL